MRKQEAWADALKGIAMLGVLMIHTGANSLPGFMGKLGETGARGVQLFFLISAYFTFTSLSAVSGNAEGSIGFQEIKDWWGRRFVKLLPLWYAALFSYLILVRDGEPYWLASRGKISVSNIIAHIFLLHGLNPYYINSILGIEWYLGDLVLFYLIAPFLYRKITSLKRALFFLAGTILGVSCIQYAAHAFIPQTDAYLFEAYIDKLCFLAQLPVFAMGICLYHLKRETDGFAFLKHKKQFSYGILIFSLCMIIVRMYGTHQISAVLGYTVFSLYFSGIIISQMIHRCPLIDNLFFRKIGQNSYPIYLFHYLLLKLYHKYVTFNLHDPWIDWLARFLIVLGTSYVVGVLLEKFIVRPLRACYRKDVA